MQTGVIDVGAEDDLVALGAGGDLTVALNGGDNGWASAQSFDPGLGPLVGMELTLVNADPFSDLLVQGPDGIHYLKGDASGQFTLTDSVSPTPAGTLASGSQPRVGLDSGVLNTDFFTDLVTVVPGTNELLVFMSRCVKRGWGRA